MKWYDRLETWASHRINTMAFIRTLLSVVTGVLSVFIFLQIFGYLEAY